MYKVNFLILLLFPLSCEIKNEEPLKVLEQIVLIIDKCPNYSRYYNEETNVKSSSVPGYEITYRDDDLILHSYETSIIPTTDTIVFPVRSNLVEIEHVYMHYDKLSFIFQKGDSILFTYENDFPTARCLNRPDSFVQNNYEKVKLDYLLPAGEIFDGISQFERDPFEAYPKFLSIGGVLQKQISLDMMKKALEIVESDKVKEDNLLDSLYAQKQLSKYKYEFFKTKCEVELAFAKFKYQRSKQERLIVKESNPTKWIYAGADSLIRFGYYNSTLDYVAYKEIYSVVPRTIAVNKKTPDYCMIYDLIKQSSLFSETEKKALLTKNMKLIIENFPVGDIENYFTNYRSDVSSNALVQHVYNEYRHMLPSSITKEFEPNVTTSSDTIYQLSLLNRDNEPVDFKDILEKHNGKLIYVDFWATHCLPCLIAMPHSGALKIEYKYKNIQFLYISIDKDKEKWEKSEVNSKIIAYPDSYILDHEGKNAMLDYFNIKSIPRYMLFDEHGELIQSNAYGPSTKEIRKPFDKYL